MFKKILFVLLMVSSFTSSFADYQFAGNIKSSNKFEDRVEFKLTNSIFSIYLIDNDIIRFRFTNHNEFSPAPSYAVIYQHSVPYSFKENKEYFEIATSELIIRVTKSPCRVSIFDKEMNLLNEDEKSFGMSFDDGEVKCFKTLFKDELFYGLGEKTKNLKKNGELWTMWNSDTPAYTEKQDPLYQSIPFFIGIREYKAYGIFFDNTYRSYFNMGASNNRFYSFGADKGELDYYFIYGPSIKKVISQYTLLTGRMELPPKWSLGYQQSKWSYYPESAVRTLAETFRNKQIPCDVIYLDIHYMNGYKVFTWDSSRFPRPERMLSDLKQNGFKVITIIDPGVKADTNEYKIAKEGLNENLFVKYPDGVVYKGEVWPGWAYFPDFTKKETREWWGEKNASLLKTGVAGIWNDMNEPSAWGQAIPDILQFDDNGYKSNYKKIHNVYALEMCKAAFEGIKKNVPGVRPFILTRAGFSGIQRYAAVWTGDNVASEIHLQLACKMVQGLSLSGVPFCGSDVGGFFDSPSQRLYTRWMQLGAFSPFFRGHTIINTRDQEPWAFGEEVEGWVKQIINLRYQLLPFFYNEFYNASGTGIPIVRSMFINFQDDDDCYSGEAQYQYMIGDNLLVAPVLSEYENSKKLYLPEGKWLDWWNNKVYEGKQWIFVEAPIDKIPLFIREGGVIPMQQTENFVGEKKMDELILKIFPSQSSAYSFYEDDGNSLNYKNNDFSITNVIVKNDSLFRMSIEHEKGTYKPERKSFILNIYRDVPVKRVLINDNPYNLFQNIADFSKAEKGFIFNTDTKTLLIKIPAEEKLNITVN